MADKQSKEEKLFNANVRELMKTSFGREFVWEILNLCGVYSDQFSVDERSTENLLGRRSVGLDLIALLEAADPTLYPNLLLSHIERNSDE